MTVEVEGWGASGWGVGAWGAGTVVEPHVVRAWATSTRTVAVELAADVRARDGLADGDALNPLTWRVDVTGGPRPRQLTVLGGVVLAEFTLVELRVLETLDPWAVAHRVTAQGLLRADGTGTIVAPEFADFPGCEASPLSAQPVYAPADLATRAPGNGEAVGTGGYVMGADGDYAMHAGAAMLRELVLRRLATLPGVYYHAPTYGLGIRPKEYTAASLDPVGFRARVARALRAEPDVRDVQVYTDFSVPGLLVIRLKVTRASDPTTPVPLELPVPVTP